MVERSDVEVTHTGAQASAKPPTQNVRGFRGTRLLPSIAPAPLQSSSNYSFFISNRTTPHNADDTVPIAGGLVNWYVSTSQANDPTFSNYSLDGNAASSAPSEAYLKNVISVMSGQSGPINQLCIFVHGLGNLLEPALAGTAAFGQNLASYAGYNGLVIGFDWPSYDEFHSADSYAPPNYAFPLPVDCVSGTIRGNINGTANIQVNDGSTAFSNLLGFVNSVRQAFANSPLNISLVCHSEGNYLAMLGLYGQTSTVFDSILLIAADINDGAMLDTSGGLAGQGSGICGAANNVTVYWTAADDVLPLSVYGASLSMNPGWHNPMYGGRLGISGPSYSASSGISQQENMISLDCSAVVNISNVQQLQSQGIVPTTYTVDGTPSTLSLHTSYLYIPQVLQDISAVLGGSYASPSDRLPGVQTGAYIMQCTTTP